MLTHNICRYTKGTVMKELIFLGIKPQQIIKEIVFMCVAQARGLCVCNTKDYIIRAGYRGRRRNKVVVWDFWLYSRRANKGIYYVVWPDEWVVVRTNFKPRRLHLLSNSLERDGSNYTSEVTESTPVCWNCGVIGYLARSWYEKKGRGVPPKSDISLPHLKLSGTGDQKPTLCLFQSLHYLPQRRKVNKNGWSWIKWEGIPNLQPSEAPKDKALIVPFSWVTLQLPMPTNYIRSAKYTTRDMNCLKNFRCQRDCWRLKINLGWWGYRVLHSRCHLPQRKCQPLPQWLDHWP